MLTADAAYVTLVGKHIPKNSLREWVKSGELSWNYFYKYHKDKSKVTKKIITNAKGRKTSSSKMNSLSS